MSKDLLIILSVIFLFSVAVYFVCKYKNRTPWGWIIFVNLSGFVVSFAPHLWVDLVNVLFVTVIILTLFPKK
jgi:hypothetical protein